MGTHLVCARVGERTTLCDGGVVHIIQIIRSTTRETIDMRTIAGAHLITRGLLVNYVAIFWTWLASNATAWQVD